MFLSNHQRLNPTLLRLTMALLVLLICATGGTLWLVHEVRKEQQAIGELLRVHTSEKIDSLAPFTEELRWQLMLTVLLLFVLVSAFVVLSLILRGYLRSQQSLRNLARQSSDILESMGQGVITGDGKGRIIFMNREASRILGSRFPTGDATYRELDARLGLETTYLTAQLLEHAHPLQDEPVEFSLAGAEVFLFVDGHQLRDEEGEVHGTVLHLRDVTEGELIRRRMQRMEGYMGLGPVAAGLQHEIKNPLSALSLHVQLLAEKMAGERDPEICENLEVLEGEVRRIGGVLEAFRNYANADVLNFAELDLVDVVDRSVKLVAPQAAEKSIRVVFERRQSLLMVADADRIQQVLINLLLNGMDAMDESGEIRVELLETDSVMEIKVIDQGSGVSKVAQPNIFDPYFTTKETGTGMGLAVCRKIARLHGGDLQFETGADGTTFCLKLPRKHDGNH